MARKNVTLTTWLPISAKVGTTPTSGGRSVGIVLSWTQDTEYSLVFLVLGSNANN
jgi:hypothetical protein